MQWLHNGAHVVLPWADLGDVEGGYMANVEYEQDFQGHGLISVITSRGGHSITGYLEQMFSFCCNLATKENFKQPRKTRAEEESLISSMIGKFFAAVEATLDVDLSSEEEL